MQRCIATPQMPAPSFTEAQTETSTAYKSADGRELGEGWQALVLLKHTHFVGVSRMSG